MNSKVQTSVFTTWVDQNGICRTQVKKNSVVDLTEAIENTKAVIKVSNNIIRPLLVDLREIKSISKPARDHFAIRNRVPPISAIAMLVKSPLSRIIGNFFLGINKPSVPTKLFSSEKTALVWLKNNFKLVPMTNGK